jgi:hypothetical protein
MITQEIYIQELLCSNCGKDADCGQCGFSWGSSLPQVYTNIVIKLLHVLRNTFQFIIHISSYNSTL